MRNAIDNYYSIDKDCTINYTLTINARSFHTHTTTHQINYPPKKQTTDFPHFTNQHTTQLTSP